MIDTTIAGAAWNQFGLDTLGAASGRLAAQWAEDTPSYDAQAMTLTLTGAGRWHAFASGVLEWRAFGAPELYDAAGASLTGVVAVLRIDPHSALRIRRLAGRRLDGRTDGRSVRPTPAFVAIRDGEPPDELATLSPGDPPLAPIDAPAGEPLTFGVLTVHDADGLCIDPVAVACLLRDLMRAFPPLRHPNGGPATELDGTGTNGAIGRIAALATGRRVQLVDLFGHPWPDVGPVGVRIDSGPRLGAGPHDWASGALGPAAASAGELRLGFAPHGVLGTTALTAPTPPSTVFPSGAPAVELGREFLRVAVVDLGLHLHGNRGADEVDGVPGADDVAQLEPSPVVVDGDTVEYLVDGLATNGAVSEVAAAPFALAVSPALGTDGPLPPTRTSRWPAFPAPTAAAQDLAPAHAAAVRTAGEAAYAGDTVDVVLTLPAGTLPAEAHVRAFPRVDPGAATVPLREIEFARRGDGGAVVVAADGSAAIRVPDPFTLGAAAAAERPLRPTLLYDLLVVARGPAGAKRHLFGGLSRTVDGSTTEPPSPSGPNPLAGIPADRRGIAPSPILGLPVTAPATTADAVLGAFALSAPREAPRYRTMARCESIVAGHDGTAFTAVISPGVLDARSVRADARIGNPGQAAGAEEHAPGLRVTGRLATELARAALRRTHHLVTRLPELDDARWATPTAGAGTLAGAVLSNVADTVDCPELRLVPEPIARALPSDWSALVAAITPFLPGALASLASSTPAPGASDRWITETKRETMSAHYGRRDTLWALRWAIAHARKLVYIETALLSPTDDPAATGSAEYDWVSALADRLGAAKDLRVVLALPKRIPFGPAYASFAQRFHVARNGVVAALQAAAPDRVVAFHPIGFPGRPETLRGTVAVVDDVWALVGGSTLSRRGLTFDGSADAAFTDRALRDGASIAVRDLRRRAMARILGLAPPTTQGDTPSAGWVRLEGQRSAFGWVRELVGRGGDGLVEPLWAGLPEAELPAMEAALADPNGRAFPAALALFGDLIAGLGADGV